MCLAAGTTISAAHLSTGDDITQNNAVVMGVLLLVIGVDLIGKGITGLTA
jgi:small neutral amino acid transporter SnatA (MarC family)